MSKHYTALRVSCDARLPKKAGHCGQVATFDNPDGLAPYLLWAQAVAAGWYLAETGRDLCPKHHQQEAARVGWTSLYEQPVPRGKPLERSEAVARTEEPS